ncbi:MAG: hypothetical protein JO263_06230 [Candidatus Eremiobacteraeota bacterium]|nr:hypothetical protein [Candidatus Eremiobacteraeota bacterium]
MNDPSPTPPAGHSVTLLAATSIEARALRRALPRARIVTAGVAFTAMREALGDCVISCGVAGGLRSDLSTGAVLVPREIGLADGSRRRCDDRLVELLAEGARRLGVEPVFDPMLTADAIVTGEQRAHWAARGFAAVDMETGRIAAPRIAAVRVVLDTPQHELSPDWERPILALLKPWNWPQAFWLAREAPRAADLAARVAAQGIGENIRITRQW